MESWIEGFARDSHPSKEISVWEKMAAIYLEYLENRPKLLKEQHQIVFSIILGLSVGAEETGLHKRASLLPKGALSAIRNLFLVSNVSYDIHDSTDSNSSRHAPFHLKRDRDTENFPDDLPEALIRRVIAETSRQTK